MDLLKVRELSRDNNIKRLFNYRNMAEKKDKKTKYVA